MIEEPEYKYARKIEKPEDKKKAEEPSQPLSLDEIMKQQELDSKRTAYDR